APPPTRGCRRPLERGAAVAPSTDGGPASSRGRASRMELTGVDWLIMVVYFAFVLGIGLLLRRRVEDRTGFFLAGRAMPAWVASLAFISANLGAQEVIGMAASGAKYGISTANFYWIGAIPATGSV